MACDCIGKVDADLAPHNTKLGKTIVLGRGDDPSYVAVTLVVEKVAPRGKRTVTMLPTFCPFCGLRYRAEPVASAATAA